MNIQKWSTWKITHCRRRIQLEGNIMLPIVNPKNFVYFVPCISFVYILCIWFSTNVCLVRLTAHWTHKMCSMRIKMMVFLLLKNLLIAFDRCVQRQVEFLFNMYDRTFTLTQWHFLFVCSLGHFFFFTLILFFSPYVRSKNSQQLLSYICMW